MNRSKIMLLGLLVLACFAWPGAAHAGAEEVAQAEMVRLDGEMHRLAARNAWRGVDRAYRSMLGLERKGAVVDFDGHWLGAQAARDMGDVTAVHRRLRRARDLQSSADVDAWIADIDGRFGRVRLVVEDKYKGRVQLDPKAMPFAPDARFAIQSAREILGETEAYAGLLPFGQYSFDAKEFQVVKSPEVLVITLAPKVTTRSGRVQEGYSRDGIRAELGPAFTSVGDSASDGLQAQGFGGLGMRAGVGFEVELGTATGALLQGGYQGILFGEAHPSDLSSAGGSVRTDDWRDSLSLFYIWGAGAMRFGDVGVAIGPTWAAGVGRTLGISDGCASGGDGCEQLEGGLAGSDFAKVPVSGTMLMAGITGSLFYGFMDMPGTENSLMGLSLVGGALSDGDRWAPFGQLALTMAPRG